MRLSFNAKVAIVSLVILISLPAAWGLYYKRTQRANRVVIKPRAEVALTIIPGWNLTQVAEYLVKKDFASSTADVYKYTGYPLSVKKGPIYSLENVEDLKILKDKPDKASLEGYLAPETFRVYKDATIADVISKFLAQRDFQMSSDDLWTAAPEGKSFYEILTLASIVEKEARAPEDMALVADIFNRRLAKNWALQSCATVNYITGKNDPGVSAKDAQINSPYNTYKYPGLPPGPICNPSLDAIKAVINLQPNNYWYFLTGDDGQMHYAKTLDEHNANKYKYLK